MGILFNKTALTEGDFITVPSATQYNLTTDISMMCWVKFNVKATVGGTYNTFLSRNDIYTLQYAATADRVQFSWNYGAGTWRAVEDTISPVGGTWYHFAGTYNKVITCIYRDGDLTNSANYTDTISSTVGTAITIGSNTTTDTTQFCRAIVADMRIYNRALSANEMNAVFACRGHDGILSGLVGRWPLNEGVDTLSATTNVFYDVSDYKNNGSIVSA